jgi:hypothetical protein
MYMTHMDNVNLRWQFDEIFKFEFCLVFHKRVVEKPTIYVSLFYKNKLY